MQGTIVCGVSTRAESHAAAQLAAALAARLGLRLVLVHVVDRGPPDRDAAEKRRRDVEPALEAIAREHCDDAEIRVLAHNRVDGLAQIAAEEGADVIVLGSSPHGMRGRRLRCTIARELEAATDVPVLIAPPETRERSPYRLALARASPEH